MGKREEMKKAIEKIKAEGKKIKLATAAMKAAKLFAYQKGVKPPKSQRSAAARDARAKTRGRLTGGSYFEATYSSANKRWNGSLYVALAEPVSGPEDYKVFSHGAPGLFQLLEELDVMYWEWVASQKGASDDKTGG